MGLSTWIHEARVGDQKSHDSRNGAMAVTSRAGGGAGGIYKGVRLTVVELYAFVGIQK